MQPCGAKLQPTMLQYRKEWSGGIVVVIAAITIGLK